MTPEEKAVINQAIRWSRTETVDQAEDASEALGDVVAELLRKQQYLSDAKTSIMPAPHQDSGCLNCDPLVAGVSATRVDGTTEQEPARECGQHVDGSVRTAETLPCWECLTDPTEDSSPWCDCRELGERCVGPCRKRAHAPDRCPNMSPAWRDRHPAPVWVETTMRQCLAGDRIRMGASEANVLRSVSGVWHADNGDAWHPRGWEHLEFRAELDVVPGFRQYPPNASIEILCTPERRAILLLQDAFPGSAVTSSDVD